MAILTDSEIVELYWARDEAAIAVSDEKYGAYCGAIAFGILGDEQAAEECVNDTCWRAWETIPPQRPARLGAFLGRIARNLSFDRYRRTRADKRGGADGMHAVLDELAECVSGGETVEDAVERKALAEAIHLFLASLAPAKRRVFVLRYWYGRSVSDIAAQVGMKPGAVSALLGRLRTKMKQYLTERGFAL